MKLRHGTSLVLAFGNDLVKDDGVGLEAAKILQAKLTIPQLDFEITTQCGFVLLEMLEGYKRALVLDAVVTREVPVGTILEFLPADLPPVSGPSAHYAGLPEVLEMAQKMKIPLPNPIDILAMEVENPYEFGEGLTIEVQKALPEFIRKAEEKIFQWKI